MITIRAFKYIRIIERPNTGHISYLTLNKGRLAIIKSKPILPFEKRLRQGYEWKYRNIITDTDNGYQPET